MRVFLDTNVLVAAFATRGLCADVLRVVLTEHDLLVGEKVLIELRRILELKLGIPKPKVLEIEEFLQNQSEVISPSKAAQWPKSDPDDRWIVAAAIEGRADCLVTGDRDLLDIRVEIPVEVVSPRGFWETLKEDLGSE